MLSRKNRFQSIVFLILVFFLLLFYVCFECHQTKKLLNHQSNDVRQPVSVPQQVQKEDQTSNKTIYEHPNYRLLLSVLNGTKNILVLKNSWMDRYATGRYPFVNAGCRVSNCRITPDTSLVNESNFDAYVVHAPTQKTRWQLANRRTDQIFILFSLEPPAHVKNLTLFENYFNWTMTYLSRSDFQLKYGEIVQLDSAPMSDSQVDAIREKVVGSGIDPSRGKSRLVAWLVSNCQAESNRQDYVKILSKFIQVDIFSGNGRCGGRNLCSRSNNTQCQDYIERTYKFYLSFENSICQDYVTEKFFDMMARNIVPVVLGGADYASIAPRHSYINALDYSPRQLAHYLTLLDRNETLYAEYFWWKPYYRVRLLNEMRNEAFCNLCESLHSLPLNTSSSVLTDAKKWFIDDSNCVLNQNYEEH